ncbi:MAG: hypothetical protein M3P85_06085 [Actinomycetota bacterium]|nr:hypothetical protein [Actinomycetota bacterium]
MGALRDTAGVPLAKNAKVFEHLNEVGEATASLTNSLERLVTQLPATVAWTRAGSELSRDLEWLAITRAELERLLSSLRRPDK